MIEGAVGVTVTVVKTGVVVGELIATVTVPVIVVLPLTDVIAIVAVTAETPVTNPVVLFTVAIAVLSEAKVFVAPTNGRLF